MERQFSRVIFAHIFNTVMIGVIALLAVYQLWRRHRIARGKKERFLTKENFTENLITILIFCVAIITLLARIFILSTEREVSQPIQMLIPATVYSIIVSLVAFGFFLSMILYYMTHKEKRYPSFRNFLFGCLLIILLLGLKMVGRILLPPYGAFVNSIVSLVIDVCLFGLLLPYVFTTIIIYIFNVVKEGN